MFVYLLHFHNAVEHAQHYVGSTAHLKQRLITHARGAGARLTEVTKEREIDWTLAGLWQTSDRNARYLERKLKQIKNAPKYCQFCGDAEKPLPKAYRYPLSLLTWTPTAADLAPEATRASNLQIYTPASEKEANEAYKYAIWGQRQERKCLGFIPAQEIQRAAQNRLLTLAKINDDHVGFSYHTITSKTNTIHIHQCFVQDDARLNDYGKWLVHALAGSRPTAQIIAKVRDDLPANDFWTSIGFQRRRSVNHKTSGNLLHVYTKDP